MVKVNNSQIHPCLILLRKNKNTKKSSCPCLFYFWLYLLQFRLLSVVSKCVGYSLKQFLVQHLKNIRKQQKQNASEPEISKKKNIPTTHSMSEGGRNFTLPLLDSVS